MPETKWNLVKGETFRPKLDFKQLENVGVTTCDH